MTVTTDATRQANWSPLLLWCSHA